MTVEEAALRYAELDHPRNPRSIGSFVGLDRFF
jgi:hypothetical protein